MGGRGLAEDHVSGGSVRPLFERIIADQFGRARDSDRFWYRLEFSGPVLAAIESTTPADVIRNNSSIRSLPDNMFFFTPGTVTGHVVQSADPSGIGGVRVIAEDSSGNVLAATVDGSYSLTELPTGASYQVRVAPPPGSIVATAVVRSVHLVAADTARVFGVDFGLSSSVPSKIGVVRADDDGSAGFSLDSNGDRTFDIGDQTVEFGQRPIRSWTAPGTARVTTLARSVPMAKAACALNWT